MTLGCADSCDKVWWPQKRVIRLLESAHFVSPRIFQYVKCQVSTAIASKILMFTQQLKRNFSSAFAHMAYSICLESQNACSFSYNREKQELFAGLFQTSFPFVNCKF